MTDARRRTIQPRHRDREDTLLGFHRLLEPLEYEWAVDRIQVLLTGEWGSGLGGADFCQNVVGLPHRRWLRTIRQQPKYQIIGTRDDADATLNLTLTVSNLDRLNGELRLLYVGNPTTTLAHLGAQISGDEDLLDYITALSPDQFFAKLDGVSVPPSLNGEQNYLPNPRELQERLSGNFFDAFLPIYFGKLYALTEQLFGATGASNPGTGQVDQVIRSLDATTMIRWGGVRAPQTETYFERYHNRPKSAVRRAAMQILAADHDVSAFRYNRDAELRREADCFSISMKMPNSRQLSIYAKTDQRIRFEVKRLGTGRYHGLPPPMGPLDRIQNILRLDRQMAVTRCNWAQVGALFDDADATKLSTLTAFVETVSSICTRTGEPSASVIESLIIDGSIANVGGHAGRAATINNLKAAGIVQKRQLRARNKKGSVPRFGLTESYHDLRLHLLTLFNFPELDP